MPGIIEEIGIFKTFLVALVIVALLGGVGYWMWAFKRKYMPHIRYWWKYRVRRKKVSEEVQEWLKGCNQLGYDEDKVRKLILLSQGKIKGADEMVYLYRQHKRVKGGLIKNE